MLRKINHSNRYTTKQQEKELLLRIHRVDTDGYCGFRAVRFDVDQDQSKWIQVKKDMLDTYLKYKDSLYKAIYADVVIHYEEKKTVSRLQSTKSPCLGECDLHLWFSCLVCMSPVCCGYLSRASFFVQLF